MELGVCWILNKGRDLFVANLLIREGLKPLVVVLTVCFVPAVIWPSCGAVMLCIAVLSSFFLLCFFRNPQRICQQASTDSLVIVSPCDGKVVAIEQNVQGMPGYTQKVSIFLSPLDVHVNWLSMSGTVTATAYHKGAFYPAFLPKSSELNERNDVTVVSSAGNSLMLRQITGTLARTIVCWVTQGQEVQVGQKYGMMKFGSRIDLFLPSNAELMIVEGQRVYGGTTVLGRWNNGSDTNSSQK